MKILRCRGFPTKVIMINTFYGHIGYNSRIYGNKMYHIIKTNTESISPKYTKAVRSLETFLQANRWHPLPSMFVFHKAKVVFHKSTSTIDSRLRSLWGMRCLL